MEKRYMNINELTDYIGLSKNTIYSWVWQRRIPYTKFGRLVKFDRRAIDLWVKKYSVEEKRI